MRRISLLMVLVLAAAAAGAVGASGLQPAARLADEPGQAVASSTDASAFRRTAAFLMSAVPHPAAAPVQQRVRDAAAAAPALGSWGAAATLAGSRRSRSSSSGETVSKPTAAGDDAQHTLTAAGFTPTVKAASVENYFTDETSKVWPAPGSARVRRRSTRKSTVAASNSIAAASLADAEASSAPTGAAAMGGAHAAAADAQVGGPDQLSVAPVAQQAAPVAPQRRYPASHQQQAEGRGRASAAAVWLPGALTTTLGGVLGSRTGTPRDGHTPHHLAAKDGSGIVRSAAVDSKGLESLPVSAVKGAERPSVSMAKHSDSSSPAAGFGGSSKAPLTAHHPTTSEAAAAAAAAATSISIAGAPGPDIRPDARIASVIRLPNGSKPKSMAFGNGTDLFVSTLVGEVFHVTARPHAPGANDEDTGPPPIPTTLAKEPGVALTGLVYDPLQHALFAAGSVTGRAYVYFLSSARPYKVTRRLALPLAHTKKWQAPYVNDVLLGPRHVYFTDSFAPVVHTVPRFASDGLLEAAEAATRGGVAPALGVGYVPLGTGFKMGSGLLNANGLAWAADGSLLVSNFAEGYVARAVLPHSSVGSTSGGVGGSSSSSSSSARAAAAEGADTATTNILVTLPVLRAGGRDVWPQVRPDCLVAGETPDVVYLSDNFEDRVLKLRIAPDYSSARVECVIQPTMPDGTVAIRAPTALAFRDGLLWVLNARLLDCPFLLPCTWQHYEAVGIRPADVCG